jgi:hypothetical protein
MKETLINNFGRVVTFKDFVRIFRDEDDIQYQQTLDSKSAKENGFNRRMIGLCLYKGLIIVSSAVASISDTQLTNVTGQRVTTSRIIDLVNKHKLDIGPNLRGITYVSEHNMSSLYDDSYVYSNISGPLSKDQLLEAVETLQKAERKYIAKQKDICFSIRKRELEAQK